MPLFSELKYNNYVPQYVGMPLNEFAVASGAVQDRYNQVREGYSLVGELADTLQTSPLSADKDVKRQLVADVQSRIEEAAKRGDFDTMQNEMRKLAKDYAKKARPIQENLARYSAAEKAIMESKLPQQHISYLRNQLGQTPGLSFDEDGIPTYSQFPTFAENVDLREVYEKYINDYKSDKAPNGIRAVMDQNTGLVEYWANGTNEKVNPDEVMAGLQTIAATDPKVRAFIRQDAASVGKQLTTSQDFFNHANPLMAAFAEKAGFNKGELQFRVGEAGRARAKAAEDKLGGLTFDALFGQPAKEGTASPNDLRKTRESLDQAWASKQDEYGKWLTQNQVDPMTGLSKNGQNYRQELDMYNQQLDAIDAQKWELDRVEADARKDAGLPATWTPPKDVIAKAEKAYNDAIQSITNAYVAQDLENPYNQAELDKIGKEAYNKSIDNSNDANTKAYRTALAKNAQSRTVVKGMTTFGKAATAELERIGDSIIAGTAGTVGATDMSTGLPIDNLQDYGSVVKNPMWTVDNDGKLVLVYETGTMDKTNFISSNKRIKITAPPELEKQFVEKKILDPLDLSIMRQVPQGKVKIGKLNAQFLTKRAAELGPAETVVVLEDGSRQAFMSQGDAVKFLSSLARVVNGNK